MCTIIPKILAVEFILKKKKWRVGEITVLQSKNFLSQVLLKELFNHPFHCVLTSRTNLQQHVEKINLMSHFG